MGISERNIKAGAGAPAGNGRRPVAGGARLDVPGATSALARNPTCVLLLRFDRADLDVAERDLSVVALQRDVTVAGLGELGHLGELALRHAGIEVLAAQDVVEILHPVDLVEAMVGTDHEADVIPFTGRLGGIEGLAGLRIIGRLVERIQPAALLRIAGLGIVFELKLRPAFPGRAAVLGDVEHDATVAAGGDVVVELQFKPGVLVGRHQIAGVVRIHARERPVLDLPSGADVGFLEIMPRAEAVAVEQQFPTGLLFLPRQDVGLGGVGGLKAQGTGHGQRNEAAE